MEAQLQIRQNAMELQDYMSDLLQWEQSIKEKEKDNKQQKSSFSKQNKTVDTTQKSICGKKSASQHTYEHYKEKWEKFNVEAALDDVDKQEKIQHCQQADDQQEIARQEADMPKPRSLPVDAEGWRQRGNEFFKLQNYESALECYDRSICMQPSHLAYANRGLARYKRGDYATSIADLNEAIDMDSKYVKAYQRRSASQKALNNFQQAAQDMEFALRLEPENKGILKERDDCVKQFLKQRGIESFEGGAWDDVSNIEIIGRILNQGQFEEIDGLKQSLEINQEEKIQVINDELQQEQWQKLENSLENEQNEQNTQKQCQNIRQENVDLQKVEESFQNLKNRSKVKQQCQNAKKQNFPKQKVEKSFEKIKDGLNLQQDEVQQVVQEGETDEQKMKEIEQTTEPQENQPELQSQNYDDSIQNLEQVKSEQRKLNVVDDSNKTSNFKFNSEQLIQQFTKTKSQMTSVDFEMKWKNIGDDLQKRVEFLWKISDCDFPKILKSSLTPQLLESIVSTVLSGIIKMDQAAERANGIQILIALSKVDRFNMTVMCINTKTKNKWVSNCEKIIGILNLEDQVKFQNVRKKYRI